MHVIPLLCASALAYPIVAVETDNVGSLVRTVETVQAGANPIDRFKIYHVRHPRLRGEHARPVILAPPLGTGFQFYENQDGPRYEESFAGFLAERGFDVWGFSQRVQDLPPGTCEHGQADCSVMADWGIAQLAADAEYVRQRIAAEGSGRLPIIGGVSLGGMIGLASIDAHPEAYAGLIAIDSALFATDPTVIALAGGGCQALSGAIASGQYYDAQQIQALKLFNTLAATAPDAPSPLFPPGVTNQQAWITVLGTPSPGPTSPTPSFIFDTGDPLAGTLTYAEPGYLHRDFDGFVDYLTFAEVRDVDCGLAGDRTFTGDLGAFTGAAFMVSNGRGFGATVDDTAALLEHAAVTILHHPDFGHQDAYFTAGHRETLELPLLRWLETAAEGR